jgi:hypothetical protein
LGALETVSEQQLKGRCNYKVGQEEEEEEEEKQGMCRDGVCGLEE